MKSRVSDRQKLVELGIKKPRESDDEDLAPPKKKLATSPSIVRCAETPHPVFCFDIQLGGFAISGPGIARLEGVLFFPRMQKEKASFALAIPDADEGVEWLDQADADLRLALEKTGIKAIVLPKLRSWDGAPGVRLVNFFGTDFPWMDGTETDPQVSTFTESPNAQHGTPILVLVHVGKKTNTSTSKTGEVVVSWPLYVQGIRMHPKPSVELLDLKNTTKPAVAFPAFP